MVDSQLGESSLVRAWRTWKIVWAVLKNLAVLIVVMLAFSRASSAFENITLSVLTLLWQGISFQQTQSIRTLVEEGLVVRRLFFGIYEKLGDDTSSDLEMLTELEKRFQRGNHIYWINIGGGVLVYVVALYNLFTAL